MENTKLRYFRLLQDDLGYPFEELQKGDMLCGFANQEGQIIVGIDYNSTQYSIDEILLFSEEVSEEEYDDFLNFLHSDKTTQFLDTTKNSIAGMLGDHIEENPETSLVTTGKFSQLRNKVLSLSKSAEAINGIIKKHSNLLKQRASTIQMQLKEQRQLMEAQMKGMQQQMVMMEHALHMANLYLGTGERVVPIRAGKKASEDTPITIRQRVLYMEEECAMIDDQTLDYSKLQDFDKYIQNPEFLQLVLPEEKGVVVLKVTRKGIKYAGLDPVTQYALNAENAKCYWLVRNGESLWRFWNELDIPEKLFPNTVQEVSTHKPGSKEYYAEMQIAAGARLTYMKIGLLLQGLIDRTMVFAPYKDRIRPALTDPETWENKITFLYDDQMTLGEGKKPFPKWLAEVNGTLRPGQRIVTGYLPSGGQVPECATGYKDNELRTVEYTKRGFLFNFTRTDIFTRKRGSYYITPECSWINFDAAPVKDFEFYFRSREARVHAREMIPLLRQCLELKLVESKEEAPFINLLKVKLIEKYGQDNAERIDLELPNLILWWKGKQRNFRPLVGDDDFNSKAFEAIITQFGTLSTKVTSKDIPALAEENTVLAYQKNESTTIVYSLTNDFERVFFDQTIFVKNRKGWIQSQFNKWQLIPPEAKVHPYTIVAKRDILEKIPADLTGQISPKVIEETKHKTLEEVGLSENQYRMPLAVYYTINKSTNKHELFVLVYRRGQISSLALKYKKEKFEIVDSWQGSGIYTKLLELLPTLNAGDVIDINYTLITVGCLDKVNILKAMHKQQGKENAESLQRQKYSFIYHNVQRLHTFHYEAWKQSELGAYLQEGGDITLFEDHIRTLIQPNFITNLLEFILKELLFHTDNAWTMLTLTTTPLARLKQAALDTYKSRKVDFMETKINIDQISIEIIPSQFNLELGNTKD